MIVDTFPNPSVVLGSIRSAIRLGESPSEHLRRWFHRLAPEEQQRLLVVLEALVHGHADQAEAVQQWLRFLQRRARA